jgi:hypothetical protein
VKLPFLAELRAAWIEAEEIASIVDGMLTPLGRGIRG